MVSDKDVAPSVHHEIIFYSFADSLEDDIFPFLLRLS
jgi:hypothetical protein